MVDFWDICEFITDLFVCCVITSGIVLLVFGTIYLNDPYGCPSHTIQTDTCCVNTNFTCIPSSEYVYVQQWYNMGLGFTIYGTIVVSITLLASCIWCSRN
jgi:hypothetical protein